MRSLHHHPGFCGLCLQLCFFQLESKTDGQVAVTSTVEEKAVSANPCSRIKQRCQFAQLLLSLLLLLPGFEERELRERKGSAEDFPLTLNYAPLLSTSLFWIATVQGEYEFLLTVTHTRPTWISPGGRTRRENSGQWKVVALTATSCSSTLNHLHHAAL